MFYDIFTAKMYISLWSLPLQAGELLIDYSTQDYCTDKMQQERRDTMSITSDILRGHTEAIILSHLLEQDSYGYQINKDIMKKTNNTYELKEATLYSAFRRLEQAGYIRTYWGDETVGARRRYYAITEEGKKAYQGYKQEWQEAKEMIDKLLK